MDTVKSRFKIVEDNLWTAIESLIAPEAIDLIIMGTSGAKGLKKLLVGSNAGIIFNSIDVPIVFIPVGYDFSRLRKIVITIENPADAPGYVDELLRLTGKWGLPFEFLHISTAESEDTDDFDVQRIEGLDEMYPNTSFGLVNRFAATVQEGLDIYQKEHPESLLVMFSNHKSFLEKVFSKSDTEQLVHSPGVPLLVIKEGFLKMTLA